MMKPSLQLRIGQQLTMTPQLQQAIRLLQLPALDLQAHVREALETNVMLEADEEGTPEPGPGGIPETGDTATHEQYAELDGSSTGGDQPDGPEVEIADESWEERAMASAAPAAPWSGQDNREDGNSDRQDQTLQDLLAEQLALAHLSPIDMAIARVLIDAISDDGYLQDDLATIRDSLLPEIDAPIAQIDKILATVQALEPAGIGARSLSECLLLQLRQLDSATPARDIAIRIAQEHLDLVANQQQALLRRHLHCSEDALEMALALVRSCHPRPGAAVGSGHAEYVIPDVFVRRTERGWIVEVNPATVPRVRVNQGYASLIARSADYGMLRAQLQEARWLLRSLEIRSETLV